MEAGMRTTCIFFLIVLISSATEEVKNLTRTEGGNITLPDPVVEFGFILYGGKNFAMVNEKKLQIVEDIYKNRILWNQNTGFFTITDLQKNDSGIYNIDSKKGRVFFTTYKLTVYETVPPPALNTLSVSSESCILLCSVDKAEETTLLWYKDEEIVNQSSSALSLPLTVHKQDLSSSYRCVAASPAEEKTLSVNVKTSCGYKDTTVSDLRHYIIPIIIPIVFTLTVLLVGFIIKCKYLHKNKRTTGETQGPANSQSEVLYTDVQINENRHSQQIGNLPDSSETVSGSQLKTVYDKLEVHRLLPDYTERADHV